MPDAVGALGQPEQLVGRHIECHGQVMERIGAGHHGIPLVATDGHRALVDGVPELLLRPASRLARVSGDAVARLVAAGEWPALESPEERRVLRDGAWLLIDGETIRGVCP